MQSAKAWLTTGIKHCVLIKGNYTYYTGKLNDPDLKI
jgi:hypothetical protein